MAFYLSVRKSVAGENSHIFYHTLNYKTGIKNRLAIFFAYY